MTLSRTEHTRLSQNLRAKKWARIGWQHPKLVLTTKVMFMYTLYISAWQSVAFPGFAAPVVCGFKLAALCQYDTQVHMGACE